MKFKTRIWMLPLSAAAMFVTGMAVTLWAGSRTSAVLTEMHEIHEPYRDSVTLIVNSVEQFRLTLQSAAAEGDVDRLKDVETFAASTQASIAALGNIKGKDNDSEALRLAFGAYQVAALNMTRLLLRNEEVGDAVQRMQKAQAALKTLLNDFGSAAQDAVVVGRDAVAAGMQRLIALNVITGLLVLAVLGAVSWLTIKVVWRDLGVEPEALRRAAERVASGDLAIELHTDGNERSLAAAVARMIHRLRHTVGTIRVATDSMHTASSEIAVGNQDLSDRTEKTSAHLQQAASSMEQLTATVRQSADAAQHANRLASTAAQAADSGGTIVRQVMVNMEEIESASRKISDIIGVIDGIAFQTNILALNAAVEAARAGEQGRGFAVVATEVRTLAQRSALAAREIKALIGASSEKVQSGSRLVKDAGTAMQEIMTGVKKVGDTIGEITAATQEQSGDIAQVNGSVAQLDRMTQQNAALVEQSAAASGSLREQAAALAESVAVFRLEREGAST